MNYEERVKVAEAWAGIAAVFEKTLPKSALVVMLDAVDDLSYNDVITVLTNWVGKTKTNRYPYPAEIREQIRPAISNEHLAREAAARVIQAVSKFGWCSPEQAKDFIGDLGWRGVERFGGWRHICSSLGTSVSQDAFYAQLRGLCESGQELARVGMGNEPIQLPEPSRVVNLIDRVSKEKSLIKK